MTIKEFRKKYHQIRIKHDILFLSELIKLYDERYMNKKAKVDSRIIFNEIHDCPIYSEKEINYIILKANELIKEQSLEK